MSLVKGSTPSESSKPPRSLASGAPEGARPRGIVDERAHGTLLSGSRIRLAFTAFTLLVIGILTALIFTMVAHIFARLTPSIRADLEWKATHGANELAHLTDVGIV